MGNLWSVGIASAYEAATRGRRVRADVAIHRDGAVWMGRGEMRFDVADLDDGTLGVLRLLGFLTESNPYNAVLFDRRGTFSVELLLRGDKAGLTRVKLERLLVEEGGHPPGIPRVVADVFEDEVQVVVTPGYFVVQTQEAPLTWVSASFSVDDAPPPAPAPALTPASP